MTFFLRLGRSFLNWFKKVGHTIGKIQTTLILSILYYFFLTPIGFVFQITSFIKKIFSPQSDTYWVSRDFKEDLKNSFNQF